MDSQPTGISTQVGSRGGDTPTSSSDQGKALVAAAGQLGSGSVQLSDRRMLGEPTPYQKANARGENPVSKTSKVSNRIPTITLDGITRDRTGSQSSLSSIGSAESLESAASTSSNMTAIDVAACKKKWEEIAELRKRMNCQIGLIKGRLKDMSHSLTVQKNVNMTVKDGVKDIVLWIERVELDHEEIIGKETAYQKMLQTAEEDRQERRTVLNRAHAQIMTNLVLQNERTSLKRVRNPKDDDNLEERRPKKPLLEKEGKKKQKKGETSDTSATMDPVEVSKRRKKRTKTKKKTGGENEGIPSVPAPRARKKRPAVNSVVITPEAGMTYAQILKDLKQNVKPDEVDVTIHSVRKTVNGNVLLAFKSSTTSGIAFKETVQRAVQEKGKVSLRTPKVTLEVRDLDETTTKEEVVEALRTVLEGTCELDTHVIGPSPRGQMTALVNTDPATATRLLDKARVRIGWVNCRIRERVSVQRCFKCLGYGHPKAKCGGPDRSHNCWRCGEPGHKAEACSSNQECFLCAEDGNIPSTKKAHAPGSGKCLCFRRALDMAKRTKK